MKVSVIGSGNVGFHLVNLFHNSKEIELCEWYSRSLNFDKRVKVVNKLSDLNEAEIYIICVSDDSILNISNEIPFNEKLVLHTSGSTSYLDMNKKNRRGVFYPLQTFSRSMELNYSDIPICIETEHKNDLKTLKNLSQLVGCKFYEINFEQRKTLHLAAIITNNFTNFLFSLSKELVEAEDLDFDILKPFQIKLVANFMK